MSKLSVHLANFRKSTPRYVQWILLVVALIVVVILFVLLNSQKQEPKIIVDDETIPVDPELIVVPDTPTDWSDTFVGESVNATFSIRANTDIHIKEITLDKAARGISIEDTCINAVFVEYNPTAPMEKTAVGIDINWFAIETDVMQNAQNAITLVIGAKEKPKPVEKIVVEPEPIVEPEYPYDDTGFEDDLADFAPSFKFDDEPKYDTPKKTKSAFGTACSDFAFPGYNTAGVQSILLLSVFRY